MDSIAQQVKRRTGIPKVRVHIRLESTSFGWLRQCQIIMITCRSWNQLSAQVRAQVSKTQKTQSSLVAAIVAVIRATDLTLKQQQNKDLITLLTDSIVLSMQSFYDINISRRQAMKKDLHQDYPALCSASTLLSHSECLFEDLSILTKDIADASKLTKKVRPPSHGKALRGKSS